MGWRGKLFARRGRVRMADGQILGAWVRVVLLLLAVSCGLSASVSAQGIAYTAPQGYTAFPFTNTACTGSVQNSATLTNNNQTEHFLTLTTSVAVLGIRATVQGSHDGVTWNDISDVATQNGSTVMGQGYYPLTRISVTCQANAGTFTVQYSGEATAPAPQIGAMVSSQSDKTIETGASAGQNLTMQAVRAPFGNSGGGIFFQYVGGSGPANSTLNVQCTTLAISNPLVLASFPLATTATVTQFFPVPLLPCDFVTLVYNAGAANVNTFNVSYVFNPITITGGDPCQGATAPKKSVPINASAAGTQTLVLGLPGHAIFVCGYNFTIAGSTSATALLEFGANAACAAGTTALSGAWAGNAVTASSDPVHILAGGGYSVTTVPTGDFLCLVAGGATPSVQGILTFIQQ
jgi:hypothetical protein